MRRDLGDKGRGVAESDGDFRASVAVGKLALRSRERLLTECLSEGERVAVSNFSRDSWLVDSVSVLMAVRLLAVRDLADWGRLLGRDGPFGEGFDECERVAVGLLTGMAVVKLAGRDSSSTDGMAEMERALRRDKLLAEALSWERSLTEGLSESESMTMRLQASRDSSLADSVSVFMTVRLVTVGNLAERRGFSGRQGLLDEGLSEGEDVARILRSGPLGNFRSGTMSTSCPGGNAMGLMAMSLGMSLSGDRMSRLNLGSGRVLGQSLARDGQCKNERRNGNHFAKWAKLVDF